MPLPSHGRTESYFQVLIVGGGLGGWALGHTLAHAGISTALFEQKRYPFHRVCGEYISNESLPFLNAAGFDPFGFGAVRLKKLLISSQSGFLLEATLDLGGFGISRGLLDHELAKLGREKGVQLFEETRIVDLSRDEEDLWTIKDTSGNQFRGHTLVLAHGKRSNLDRTLKRPFMHKRSPYVGIKYHINHPQESDLIALHNFEGGYAGISKVEKDASCFCYLVHRDQLRRSGSIDTLEKLVLSRNPYLKQVLEEGERLWDQPITINEISFETKATFKKGIFFVGDSAGMVVPLFGNGMSMAMHAGKILGDLLVEQYQLGLTEKFTAEKYRMEWNRAFSSRLRLGRILQKGFGKTWLTGFILKTANAIPPIKGGLIKMSHGEPF